MTNAIEIEGLRKVYAGDGKSPPKEALKGLDLTIPTGSIFGLLGPNGAGKSTTINIMAGLVRKTAGKVRIWGFDQDVNPRQSRAAIGVMPQELNLDPFFSPADALEVQAGLSGGMRRRLLLAKALVHHPQVLVLDEPTAGVDIELRQMLWRNVRRLNQERGTTIILTTHYLEEAQEMCDEIAIVANGELVIRDKTVNLLSRLDAKTMVITPETPPGDLDLPAGVDLERRADGSLAFSYARAKTSAEQLLSFIREAGISIRDVRTEEADLEDVFVSLTHAEGSQGLASAK